MSYEVYLTQYDRTGTIRHAVVQPLWARWTNSLYDDQPLVWALEEGNPQADDFAEFDIVEVYLRNKELGIQSADGGFVRDFVGILRPATPDGQQLSERQTSIDGVTWRVFKAPEQKHILSWRHVLWASGIANRSQFTSVAAETIMKTLVNYNATALATVANGRWREGDLSPGMGFTVNVLADAAAGNVLSKRMMGGNLLNILGELATIGGGDFSVSWQGIGTATFDFDFHLGQLGEDKSTGADRVLFAIENNTMKSPRLVANQARATVAVSAGRGTGAGREVDVVTGTDFAADNDLEMFVDARNETSSTGRINQGNEKLYQARAVAELVFEVIQTEAVFYSPVAVTGRKTYALGDFVLASYGVDFKRKVVRVSKDWRAPSAEDALIINIDTENEPP
jgi:hypothetical protein